MLPRPMRRGLRQVLRVVVTSFGWLPVGESNPEKTVLENHYI
jgi:hypothetical protein